MITNVCWGLGFPGRCWRLSCVAASCVLSCQYQWHSPGRVILHWNARTESGNEINTGSRVSDVTTEREWECFLKSNSSVIEFQTKQHCHDEKGDDGQTGWGIWYGRVKSRRSGILASAGPFFLTSVPVPWHEHRGSCTLGKPVPLGVISACQWEMENELLSNVCARMCERCDSLGTMV